MCIEGGGGLYPYRILDVFVVLQFMLIRLQELYPGLISI